MIIIDESKLKYDTLYRILKELDVGEDLEELKIKYHEDWIRNTTDVLNRMKEKGICSNVKNIYEIIGNEIDKHAYVDYWIDDIKWYNLSNEKMIELAKDLIDVIHEEYRDKNNSLDDIDEVFRILEVMKDGLRKNIDK